MARSLHEQIADDLRSQISAGELAVGDALPSESQLQERWHGSRAPVRQALAALRAEGLIEGGRGKPPVVRRARLAQPFDAFVSFSRWVEQLGRLPGQQTLECALRPAGAEDAELLEVDEGAPVVQLLRLRLIDDVPTMVERSTFTQGHGRPLFDADLDAGSVYALLVAGGLEIGSAQHAVDAIAADELDARLLDVAVGAPLLRERRVARTADGTPFESADDRYRGDLVAFTIDNSPRGAPAPERRWTPTPSPGPPADPSR